MNKKDGNTKRCIAIDEFSKVQFYSSKLSLTHPQLLNSPSTASSNMPFMQHSPCNWLDLDCGPNSFIWDCLWPLIHTCSRPALLQIQITQNPCPNPPSLSVS